MQSRETYLNKKLNNTYKLIKLYSTLKHLNMLFAYYRHEQSMTIKGLIIYITF